MKLLVALALVAVVAAAPRPQDIELQRYENTNDGTGSYRYSYEQSDGQTKIEEGELRNAGRDDQYIAVKGSYGWTGPDGVDYKVNYISDDNGFQPTIEQGPGGGVPPGVVASLLG